MTALIGASCGLDEMNLVGAWAFCSDDSCAHLAKGGVRFGGDGTYVEIYEIDSAETFCESPANFARGTYSFVGKTLNVKARAGDAQKRTVEGGGDLIILTYARVGLWDGGRFPLRRLHGQSRGACFDPASPKKAGASCTPMGMFHGNRATPPTIPRIDETKECASGFCITLTCQDGREPSICARSTCKDHCPNTEDTCVPFNKDLGGGAYCLAVKRTCGS